MEIKILSNESLASCREILTDERLDYLADRFLMHSVRHYTGIPFHKYLDHPDEFDRMADYMRKGLPLVVKQTVGDTVLIPHTMN